MPGRYRRSNPLALAVLALLWERDMHPYEMAATLRQRHKEESIKLNYGSLYTVVESLERHGLIVAVESRREGRRPERTVYALTEPGRQELHDWMRELIAVPVKEYPRFEAGMSLAGILPPDDVAVLLEERAAALQQQIADLQDVMAGLRSQGLPQIVYVEVEYRVAVLRAEHAWVDQFVATVRNNELEGLEEWRDWQAGHELPRWFNESAGSSWPAGHKPANHDPANHDREKRPDT